MPAILSLNAICLTFGGSPLLDGASLTIQQGDRHCLVGRNGSGKSTLLKIMAGLAEPDAGLRVLNPGYTVGYMDQDPDFAGFATLGDYAGAGLVEEHRYRIAQVMEGVHLPVGMRPDQASGGERRRASMARLLASDYDLLLLDEPTNHLDIQVIGWLEQFLQDTDKTFVVISHDRAFLRRITKSTLWVDRGIVRQQDKGFGFFEAWRDRVFDEEDLARHKLDRLLQEEGRWAVEGISARRKRNMGRVRRLAEMRQDRAEQIRRSGTAKLELAAGAKSGRMVVEAHAISKSFAAPVVRDFSIKVTRGERIALVGPNGSGKTTLLKLLTGQMAPDRGSVKLGTNLRIALFDQNRDALDPDQSLWDSLAGDRDLGVSGKNDQVMVRGKPRHVVAYLKDFLFAEAQARGPVSALSGGEKARLMLARIFARESNLLVLDEPTNDLDVETLDLLQELIDDYDGTVVLVSHDRDFLDRVATTTIAMESGGTATAYAGGWSDYQAQKGADAVAVAAKPKAAAAMPVAGAAKAAGLSFTQAHRLRELPGLIVRLEAEIGKLAAALADPGLFASHPARFGKISDGLALRQGELAKAEDEWLALEALREGLEA